MRSCVLGVALLVVWLACLPASMAGEPERQARGSLVIELRGDLLSVQLHNAPWAAVLQELERLTGIELRVAGPLAGTLTQTFEALPLEQGLRRVFHQANWVFFYVQATKGKQGADRLHHVWLFPKEGHVAEEGQLRSSAAGPAAIHSPKARGSWSADAETDLPALRDALSNEDATVRSYAIQALAWRERASTTALWRLALRDPNPGLRLQVVEGLARYAEGHALLQEALADEDETVRSLAASWMEQRGSEAK